MSNRQQRRAFAAQNKFFRVVPILKRPDGTLEECVQTSLIDAELEDCFVIRVPPSTSTQQAREIEAQLTQTMKKPCLVVTRNIEFCRVEPVGAAELAHLIKGVENHGPTEEERRTMLANTVAGAVAVRRSVDALPGEGTVAGPDEPEPGDPRP